MQAPALIHRQAGDTGGLELAAASSAGARPEKAHIWGFTCCLNPGPTTSPAKLFNLLETLFPHFYNGNRIFLIMLWGGLQTMYTSSQDSACRLLKPKKREKKKKAAENLEPVFLQATAVCLLCFAPIPR